MSGGATKPWDKIVENLLFLILTVFFTGILIAFAFPLLRWLQGK